MLPSGSIFLYFQTDLILMLFHWQVTRLIGLFTLDVLMHLWMFQNSTLQWRLWLCYSALMILHFCVFDFYLFNLKLHLRFTRVNDIKDDWECIATFEIYPCKWHWRRLAVYRQSRDIQNNRECTFCISFWNVTEALEKLNSGKFRLYYFKTSLLCHSYSCVTCIGN